jgi:hypothetical protein
MYAHEVFKSYHGADWQKSFYCQLIQGYMDLFKKTLQGINDAVKFHMGRQSEVNHAAGGERTYADVFSQSRFPYDNCWFDYISDVRIDSPASHKFGFVTPHVRSALLCSAFDEGLYTVMHFTALDSPDTWTMDPVISFVANRPLVGYESIRHMLPSDPNPDAYVSTCLLNPTLEGERVITDMADELIYNAGSDISTLGKFLMLLNCKNHVFQEIQVKNKPLKSRNEKRVSGSFKYSYKLLRLDLGKEYGGVKSLTQIKNLWTNPLHSCRGHFKTYTPEHRLFGRHIGTFWIPPHMRGRAEVGIVKKEYEVTA